MPRQGNGVGKETLLWMGQSLLRLLGLLWLLLAVLLLGSLKRVAARWDAMRGRLMRLPKAWRHG